MWHIPVRYQNYTDDIVPSFMLDDLIKSKQIIQFYRPSEGRWVTIGLDPIRKIGRLHGGPERRRPVSTNSVVFAGSNFIQG